MNLAPVWLTRYTGGQTEEPSSRNERGPKAASPEYESAAGSLYLYIDVVGVRHTFKNPVHSIIVLATCD